MRKTALFLVFFLAICLSANAQYRLERSVVGTGGVVGVTTNGGSQTYKVSGVSGQTAIGKFVGESSTGSTYNIYNGFWVPEPPVGIEEEVSAGKAIVNFPNPANVSTTFKFNIEASSYVTLKVYNLAGSTIATIVNDFVEAGEKSYDWNLRNVIGEEVASGSYIYELTVNPMSAGFSSKSYSLKNVVMITR